jgi:hypothetical protein
MAQDYVELASHIMLHPLSQIKAASKVSTSLPNKTSNGASTMSDVESHKSNTWTSNATMMIPQSQYLVHVSALGFLKSPVRRPMVIERWSPYEIAIFEGSIAEYGKNFSKVQKEIGSTKSIADVIEFYYIWKKTSHYSQWKKEYIPDHLDTHSDD